MSKESLKSEIYDRVETLRFTSKKWAEFIKAQLLKEIKRDVPLELIYDIINEIKEWKRLIKENTEVIDDLQSKQLEKEDGWLKEIADSDNEPQRYDVSERHYIFYKQNKPYKVLISTVRAIFESYSKYGQNLSGEEIRQKFKLPAGIFELIKSATGLYKSSHIDDPVTLSRLSEDWLEEYIEWKVERVLEDKYITQYERAVSNKQKKDLARMAISNRGYDIFMTKFEEALKKYKPRNFDNIKLPNIPNNDSKDVIITDAHLWKQWTDGVVIRFQKLTRDLIASPEKNLNISFLGDLWECFIPHLWEMHWGQRLGMENINTEDLIMLITDVLDNMLSSLYKAWKNITFNWLWGNHSRFTEKKDFDPQRTPEMLIYRFLQKILENTTIKVNILRDKANVIKSWKIKYVFLHWDSLSEAEIRRRALNEIEDWYYLVFCSWDRHHYEQLELAWNVLWIKVPWLAWAWQYDKSLALSSLPWHVEFKMNADWVPDIIVKRYKDN